MQIRGQLNLNAGQTKFNVDLIKSKTKLGENLIQ